MFTAHRGCFIEGRRYSRRRACRAPSASAYRCAVRAFDDAIPVGAHLLGLERGQSHLPADRPAARASPCATTACCAAWPRSRRFRVLAADVLDTSNMGRYLRAPCDSRRAARVCGGCTTTRTSTTAHPPTPEACSRSFPGEVWLTETNGIVKFGNTTQFRYSESRAARRTR